MVAVLTNQDAVDGRAGGEHRPAGWQITGLGRRCLHTKLPEILKEAMPMWGGSASWPRRNGYE